MILLDEHADTFPVGLEGTPFEEVYRALRIVAAMAWSVDPLVYRAGMAWGWYALHAPSALAVDGFRSLLCAALVSECAPLVRESQTVGELLALLTLWMDYRPVFADMEALFVTYGVHVDVRAISDPEGQALLPVDDTRLAFYIFVLSMDWARPMLLGEIAETARRASPIGARPFVVYLVEGFVSVPVAIAPTDGFLWVDVWDPAVPVVPPVELPTVSVTGNFGTDNWLLSGNYSSPQAFTLSSNQVKTAYKNGVTYNYDATKSYGVIQWQKNVGTRAGSIEVAIVSNSGKVALKNVSSSAIGICQAWVAVCSSNQATVVTVYSSSNLAYNAFKFTAGGTNYYYVLDGTQTDWVSNLSSIGYRDYIDFLLGFKWNDDETALVQVTDLSNDYYWARVIERADKVLLVSMGIWYNTAYKFGTPIYDSTRYSYSVIGLYSDMGETAASGHDLSLCEIRSYTYNVVGLYYDGTSSEAVMTWKCRITSI